MKKNPFALKKSSILLIALIVIAAGVFAVRERPQAFGLYACEGGLMTRAQIAQARGISAETVSLLGGQRGLLPDEICAMPEAKLTRAIERANHPKPDRPDEAFEFRKLQLQDENGYIPADGLMKAAEKIDMMQQKLDTSMTGVAGISRGGWRWLGPGNIGGRVRAIAIHPTTPSTLWIGSVSGGIWKTTNSGASWTLLDDFMANMAVSTLLLDPGNPNVLYAGTGEGFYNSDGLQGAGIFKTTDGGTTWAQLPNTNNWNFYYVNRLALSPNRSTILAATGTGIWRSTDGGNTWSQTLTTRTLDVVFHPTDNTKAIASGSYGKAWYSTNGGLTWSAAGGLPSLDWLGRVEVAYAPSNPTIVYASVSSNSGEIWKSTNGGASYTRVHTGSSYLGSQGWYDNTIWVSPVNYNMLVVGGIDLWRSTNGGSTLTKISQWWNAPLSAHADNHIILAAPGFNGTTNKTVYVGNDGGVYRAADITTVSGTSGWTELNNGLGITQFYGAAGNPTTGEIIGGTQDNGTLFYTPANGSEGWTSPYGGDGGWSAADPSDPNYFYGEYVNLMIHRSTNRGISSSNIYSGLGDAGTCANFIAPFILDPNNPNTMLAGGCHLWRSTDVKAPTPTWSNISAGIAISDNISAIAVAPGNSNIIWIGFNGGAVYKTSNGTSGAPTWTAVSGLPGRYVTRITIDKNDSQKVYVTFGGFSPNNVYRTLNGGTSWSDITGSGLTGLPDLPVRSLVIHPDNSNWLYAGTELGIFASEDGGANWGIPHDGPTNTSVDELFFLNTSLVAATHGRGLYMTRGTPPPTPANFRITSVSETSASMAWDDVAGEAGYKIYKWNGYDTFVYFATVSANTTTFTDTSVACGTSAWYELSAYNEEGESTHAGWIQANMPVCPPAPNDDFSAPFQVTGLPYTRSQDTSAATLAGDDPALTGCSRNAGNASVWYVYTPASNQAISFNTFGSNYDTMIGVWSGSRGSLTEITCNDDANGTPQSSVNVAAIAGTTYYIGVSEYNGSLLGEAPLKAEGMGPAGALEPQAGGQLTFNAAVAQGLSVRSTGAYDGFILESGETSEKGLSINAKSTLLYVGDDSLDRQYLSVLSFNTSGLPDNATIVSVILKLKKYAFAGTDPFSTHGNLLVDIQSPFYGLRVSLEGADFQAATNLFGAGIFNGGATPDALGWYTVALDPASFPFISKTGTTQLRLRFSLDDNDDRGVDLVRFFSGNAAAANQPLIEILYSQ